MGYTAIDYKKRICQAMNFISQNLERNLSLDEIAETASLSRFHFHRIFKAVAGETVADFTRRLRLEAAANRLLSQPLAGITPIAIACGFSSSQNFAKAFRQHFGMTPSAYRQSKIGNKDSKKENVLSLRTRYDSDSAFLRVSNPKKRNIKTVAVKELPEYHLAYVRRVGPYVKETCAPQFEALMQWAAPRHYVGPDRVFAIYWDNPEVTPPEKCRFDAGIIVPEGTTPEGEVYLETISGGPYALCHFECQPAAIQTAWEDAFAWLCDSGYACDDSPCYEVYHNDAATHPQGQWIFDICIPLRDGFD
jgi:AraC family transcriptional regulator